MEYRYWSIASNLVIRAKCFLRWTKAATTIIIITSTTISTFSIFIHLNQYIRSVYHTHTHTAAAASNQVLEPGTEFNHLLWGTLLAIWFLIKWKVEWPPGDSPPDRIASSKKKCVRIFPYFFCRFLAQSPEAIYLSRHWHTRTHTHIPHITWAHGRYAKISFDFNGYSYSLVLHILLQLLLLLLLSPFTSTRQLH